ncbi:MAG: prolyl oligopeptidase family serine peptidase [Gaiellaceae bacterium]
MAFTVAQGWSRPHRLPESRIWVAADGAATEVTSGPGADRLPRWSADGRSLAYVSDRDARGRTTVSLLGSDAPLADLAGSVEALHWLPGGEDLLLIVSDPDGSPEGNDPRVLQPSGAHRRLLSLDALTGAAAELGPEDITIWELGEGSDGRAVAIVSEDPSESGWYSAWLALLDLETRTATAIHRPTWQISTPRISPDGASVAFVEGICSDRGVLAGMVSIAPLERGSVRTFPLELDVSDLLWLDPTSLLCAGWRGMGSVCGVLSVDGSWDELWAGESTLGQGGRPAISASTDGTTIAAIKQSLAEPAEATALDTGRLGAGWRPLSRLNAEPAAELVLPQWRTLCWRAPDGLEIAGLLALPRAPLPGPLPLVVLVHGGPTGVWSFQFAQLPVLLATAGYAVLLPNPRGSTGRGQEFARATIGDLGGAELGDILAGVDACVAAGVADGDRVGIAGGSHGGYMAAWAVTQTERFAAAVPWACVSDLLSAHYGSNIAGLDDVFMGTRPHQSALLYVERSPVVYAHRCATPTLIVHGEDDPFCPVGQAHELYEALVAAGVETELVVYPREGHGWNERDHVLDFWRRTCAWLDRHLAA